MPKSWKRDLTSMYKAALRVTHENNARRLYLCAVVIEENTFLSRQYGCDDHGAVFRRAIVDINGNIMPGAQCVVLGYYPYDKPAKPKGYYFMSLLVPSRIRRIV